MKHSAANIFELPNMSNSSVSDWISSLAQIDEKASRLGQDQICFYVQSQRTEGAEEIGGCLNTVDKLAAKISEFQQFLINLKNQKAASIFIGSHDCFGAEFEFALACQKRVFLSTHSNVGFPEMARGGFPLGGLICAVDKMRNLGIEQWLDSPVIMAIEAKIRGLIDCFIPLSIPHSELLDWVRQNFFHIVSTCKEPQKTGHYVDEVSALLTKVKLSKPQQFGKQENFLAASRPYNRLVKLVEHLNESKFADTGTAVDRYSMNRLIASTILGAKNQSVGNDFFRNVSLDENTIPLVTIDVGDTLPPTEVLARLLSARKHLIICGEKDALIVGVDVLLGRLERLLGQNMARKLSRKQIFYAPDLGLKEYAAHSLSITWQNTDQLELQYAGKNLLGISLSSVSLDSSVGLLEFDREQIDSVDTSVVPFLGLISNGWIAAYPIGSAKIPVSVWVRSMAVNEVLKFTSLKSSAGIATIIDQLSEEGWGFLGDMTRLEKFLRLRQQYFTCSSEEVQLGGVAPSSASWKVGLGKELRDFKQPALDNLPSGPEAVSLFFAIFAVTISDFLKKMRVIEDPEQCDRLVGHALEIPFFESSLPHVRSAWGRRRLEAYGRDHWPDIVKEMYETS